jgi:transposase
MTQNFFGNNPLNRLPLLPYSPDISPSDFYLFWKVKSALTRRETFNEIDLLEAITEIFNGISDAELQGVFQS